MNSQTLPQFWTLYYRLPSSIRQRAVKAYRIWQVHPESPGLQFKRVGNHRPVNSVRITDAYRALGLVEGDTIYWFWIGPHDEYERVIQSM